MEHLNIQRVLKKSEIQELLSLIADNFQLLGEKIESIQTRLLRLERLKTEERIEREKINLKIETLDFKIMKIELTLSKKISNIYLRFSRENFKLNDLERKISSLEKAAFDRISESSEQIRLLNLKFQRHYHEIWLKGWPNPASTFGPRF